MKSLGFPYWLITHDKDIAFGIPISHLVEFIEADERLLKQGRYGNMEIITFNPESADSKLSRYSQEQGIDTLLRFKSE